MANQYAKEHKIQEAIFALQEAGEHQAADLLTERLKTFLVEAPIQEYQPIGKGKSGSFFAIYPGGIKAVYKYSNGNNGWVHSTTREVFAFEVSDLYHLRLVPTTVFRGRDDNTTASVQIFVADSTLGTTDYRSNHYQGEDRIFYILDFLLRNRDRHNGNYLYTPFGQRVAIDHGLTGRDEWAPSHIDNFHGDQDMPEYSQILQNIAQIDDETVTTRLTKFKDHVIFSFFIKRRKTMLDWIKKQAEYIKFTKAGDSPEKTKIMDSLLITTSPEKFLNEIERARDNPEANLLLISSSALSPDVIGHFFKMGPSLDEVTVLQKLIDRSPEDQMDLLTLAFPKVRRFEDFVKVITIEDAPPALKTKISLFVINHIRDLQKMPDPLTFEQLNLLKSHITDVHSQVEFMEKGIPYVKTPRDFITLMSDMPNSQDEKTPAQSFFSSNGLLFLKLKPNSQEMTELITMITPKYYRSWDFNRRLHFTNSVDAALQSYKSIKETPDFQGPENSEALVTLDLAVAKNLPHFINLCRNVDDIKKLETTMAATIDLHIKFTTGGLKFLRGAEDFLHLIETSGEITEAYSRALDGFIAENLQSFASKKPTLDQVKTLASRSLTPKTRLLVFETFAPLISTFDEFVELAPLNSSNKSVADKTDKMFEERLELFLRKPLTLSQWNKMIKAFEHNWSLRDKLVLIAIEQVKSLDDLNGLALPNFFRRGWAANRALSKRRKELETQLQITIRPEPQLAAARAKICNEDVRLLK